ncbi:PR domain zinc finger protein 15 [Anopheles maculipalpis]|uniref:PR domain zinc finger protein 15 n=1 Tax=Anopheles maculipalpis TaxID=1496333 RepID=UPI002158D3E5|nr:PR domain zinc finger protein 15 [Anopheles maculipalpis]
MPASCVVPDCDLKYTHNDDVSFHKFPLRSPELLKQWIHFTGRDENWHPTKWSALCSRHFLPADFKGCASRKILLPTAVPSVRPAATKCQSNDLSLPVISYETVWPGVAGFPAVQRQEFDYEQENDPPNDSLCPVLSSEGVEELEADIQLIDITCRICGVIFSRAADSLLFDLVQSEEVVRKYLPFVNLELSNLPRKICLNCSKVVSGFSKFSDSVLRAQSDLEHRFAQQPLTPFVPESPFPAASVGKPVNIKQEPIASLNIKEEKVENAINSAAARQKDSTPAEESIERPMIIKNQAVLGDPNRIFLFNNLGQENAGTSLAKQQTRESSKNCEILEIVNLYPPIVDITSTTVTEVQPYEITLPSVTTATPSDAFSSHPSSSSAYSTHFVSSLKVENTTELDTEQDDYYLPEKFLFINTLEEHSYTKLPIQADDNKDEIFHDITAVGSGQWFVSAESISTPQKHEPIMPPREATQRWSCKVCGRQFTRHRRMLYHRTWECSGRKKLSTLSCTFCHRKFSTWGKARVHLCMCSKKTAKRKRFKWKSVLARANLRRTVVDGESDRGEGLVEKNACPLCDRSYANASNLRRHLSTHRPPEQWNHKCGVCFRIFDKLFDLKKHLQIASCGNGAHNAGPVHNSEPSPEKEELPTECDIIKPDDGPSTAATTTANQLLYVCPTCNKIFQSYSGLKVHEPIHTGAKAYICEKCGKCFSGPSHLWQHQLTHSELRQYNCEQCPKVFKRKCGLSQHVRAIHMKIKPFQCPTCGHGYALKADMTRCRHSRLNDPSAAFVSAC